jgi:SAM-dependent methyltransferase
VLDLLRALYDAAPSGLDAPEDDRREVERSGGEGAQAYGELSEASALRLLRWLAPGEDDVMYDLGAGTGKLVLLAACATRARRVVGVELSRHHHGVAMGVLEALVALVARVAPEDAASLRERVSFVRADLRTVDVADATIVYACSTCFPDDVRAVIAEKALAAPRLRALVSTRALPQGWEERFEVVGRVKVRTSWSDSEHVLVYRRR